MTMFVKLNTYDSNCRIRWTKNNHRSRKLIFYSYSNIDEKILFGKKCLGRYILQVFYQNNLFIYHESINKKNKKHIIKVRIESQTE